VPQQAQCVRSFKRALKQPETPGGVATRCCDDACRKRKQVMEDESA